MDRISSRHLHEREFAVAGKQSMKPTHTRPINLKHKTVDSLSSHL